MDRERERGQTYRETKPKPKKHTFRDAERKVK